MRGAMLIKQKFKGEFISTWDTTQPGVSANNQIALPLLLPGAYDFKVYDSDGNFLKHITDYQDNIVTLPVEGIQQIICVGQFERFYINNVGDKLKLLSIQQFGSDFKVVNGIGMFFGAENLTEIGDDIDVSQVTSMVQMFGGTTNFNQDISAWDFSAATSLVSFMQGKTFNDYDAQYYTNLLKRWSENAPDNLSPNMGSIKYTAEGQQYKDILQNVKGWSITDGGQE